MVDYRKVFEKNLLFSLNEITVCIARVWEFREEERECVCSHYVCLNPSPILIIGHYYTTFFSCRTNIIRAIALILHTD